MQHKNTDLFKGISKELLAVCAGEFADVLNDKIGSARLDLIADRTHDKALFHYYPSFKFNEGFLVQIICNVTFEDKGKFKNVPTFHFEKSVFVGFDGNIVISHDIDNLATALKKMNL